MGDMILAGLPIAYAAKSPRRGARKRRLRRRRIRRKRRDAADRLESL